MEGPINSKFEIRNSKLKFGFTLTEIVIVLGIIGIITSAILPLFVNVVVAGRSSAYYSNAYKIADSRMEEHRNTNFDLVASETITAADLPNGQVITEVTNDINGTNEAEMKRVELTVSWNYQRPQEIKLVTYIYRGGL